MEIQDDHDMLFLTDVAVSDPHTLIQDDLQLDRQNETKDVLAKIEYIFETVTDALLNERDDVEASLTAHTGGGSERSSTRTFKTLFTFPGRTNSEAWRFSVIMRLLELIRDSISEDATLTKRDLYYRDPALFGRQTTVDRYIDHIAAAFAVSRSSLHVIAGVKGLIAGAAIIHRRDGSKADLATVQSGMLIPNIEEVLSMNLSRVRWVLVIEKELKATFQSILSSEAWEDMQWHAVVVTGKGYPDIATRAMTRFMSLASPRNGFAEPPVFGLMDYDPDGMAILHTYKHGSSKPCEENDNLIVPTIRWAGLRSGHITDETETHRNQGLMLLTRRDRHKARKMLEWRQFSINEEAEQWRRELQVMLVLNLKAEIQMIDSEPSGLTSMIKEVVSDA